MAYANRDFKKAVDILSELIYQQPQSARWSEMRAQVQSSYTKEI